MAERRGQTVVDHAAVAAVSRRLRRMLLEHLWLCFLCRSRRCFKETEAAHLLVLHLYVAGAAVAAVSRRLRRLSPMICQHQTRAAVAAVSRRLRRKPFLTH